MANNKKKNIKKKTQKKKVNNKKKNSNSVLKNRNIIIITLISIICLLTLIISSTYSILVTNKESPEKTFNSTGNLNVTMNEAQTSYINLSNAVPTSDDIGKNNNPYKFSISANQDNDYYTKYTIKLVPEAVSTIPANYIKVQVNDDAPALLSSFTNNIISTGYLDKNQSRDFEIRIWLDINATTDMENKVFEGRVVVVGEAVRSIDNN